MKLPSKITFALFIIVLYFFYSSTSSFTRPSFAGDAKTIKQPVADPELAEFIDNIKAVDNHSHANTVAPNDEGSDALPLEALLPFEIPARLRPNSPDWLAAYQGLYKYSGTELTEQGMQEFSGRLEQVMKEKGEKFPEWVLGQTGIEVMLTNRISMGPGLSPPQFRWVSFVDALLYPLSTKAEAALSPDRKKLFPYEVQHLRNYMTNLKIASLPATLDAYLRNVVTPTLESQKGSGCVAVKFEVGFLRKLDFDKIDLATASNVYSQYVHGGEPPHVAYKSLQDYIFRYIALEAGRLGMAVHIHTFPGPGNYYDAMGSDPLLLEPVFNDPELANTKFVLIHGGGSYSGHTGMMLWKPNVYADISALTRIWTTQELAGILASWLSQFPEKILFGTDAASFGPGLGWELGAWIASKSARDALTLALSEMMENNEISDGRAKEIASMVMRENANDLYNLNLR